VAGTRARRVGSSDRGTAESNTIDVIGWCSVDALWDDGRVNTMSSLDCLGPRSDSLRAPAVARSRLTI